jgi:hypothetical protein
MRPRRSNVVGKCRCLLLVGAPQGLSSRPRQRRRATPNRRHTSNDSDQPYRRGDCECGSPKIGYRFKWTLLRPANPCCQSGSGQQASDKDAECEHHRDPARCGDVRSRSLVSTSTVNPPFFRSSTIRAPLPGATAVVRQLLLRRSWLSHHPSFTTPVVIAVWQSYDRLPPCWCIVIPLGYRTWHSVN